MSAAQLPQDKRTLLFLGNRWVNTIYSNYGIIKQRILLQLLEQCQPYIKDVMHGKKVQHFKFWSGSNDVLIDLDLAAITHYNNYYQVRKALNEMSKQDIQIYNDPSYKQPIYAAAPLLNAWHTTDNKRVVKLAVKRQILELLLHVDYSAGKAKQYTKFDPQTITYSSCKYMHPLYLMLCSYSERGGFTIPVEDLRQRLQVEEKYAGFDNFNKFILKHLQKELQISGKYCFNYSLVKTGRTVKSVTFKIFANKVQFDYNHVWLKIQRALTQELPYYMQFTEQQRAETNYLLTGKYDLDEVYTKLKHIHTALVKKQAAGQKVHSRFAYFIQALHRDYPPPDH